MSSKTRYLQLSDTTIAEYVMNDELDYRHSTCLYLTKLADNHFAILEGLDREISDAGSGYVKLPDNSLVSLNTIAHFNVPTDNSCSEFYSFIDNNYKYIDSDALNMKNSQSSPIMNEYLKYCEDFAKYESGNPGLGYDYLRLYFVSGYDFSDIFSATVRLSIDREDGSTIDLCNFMYTQGSIFKYIKFMTKPIIFGNFIYDKFIEIALPSIKNSYSVSIISNENNTNYSNFGELIFGTNTSYHEPILKLMFSYVEDDDKKITDTEIKENEIVVESCPNTSCVFSKTNSIKGSIPTQTLTSDNLGVYIAEHPEYPCIEFYGTWKGEALSSEIVNTFNNSVQLYDKRFVNDFNTYEIDDNYDPRLEKLKQWVAVHEITCRYCIPGNTKDLILKTDTYSMTQVFYNDENETTRFYYRPIIFDDIASRPDVFFVIDYSLRFINIRDGVQFLKQGSLSGININKFNVSRNTINVSTNPYKIYNKIIEQKNTIVQQGNNSPIKSKYVKVFYDTTQISLDVNGEPYNNGTYTLPISRSPKNYKFVFKQKDFNDNIKYFDLRDGSYKLYVKETNGNEIILEPTYSNNMNLSLGEIEFNVSNSIINRLRNVSPEDRYISIVSYNADGSTSSMYDMMFSI